MRYSGSFVKRLSIVLTVAGLMLGSSVSLATRNIAVNLVGDKSIDLISILSTNQIEISEADGLGGFNPPQVVALNVNPILVKSDDINSDGLRDLIMIDTNGDVSISINDQINGFQTATQLAVGLQNLELVKFLDVGDMNNDGLVDIIVSIDGVLNGRVTILFGDGLGGFSIGQTLEIPSMLVTATSLNLADINHDNSLDVSVKDIAGTVHMILSDGVGGYNLPQALVGTLPLGGIYFFDYNNDQIPDLIALDQTLGLLTLRLGVGDGSFLSGLTVSVGLSPVDVAAFDINYDGNKDVVVVNSGDSSLNVLLGDGLGGLVDLVGSALDDLIGTVPGLTLPVAIVSFDINLDCRKDVALWDEITEQYTVVENQTGAEPADLIYCSQFAFE
ncbi:FG-GAP repeat domain-containing protein [Marinicella litoralis]|uniref:VCBS repeat protein n=1 Tax=Marinicella litoralis TaxID=644220 RepID=A0A4R6XJN3_9GAMM|nr:VCBS repeat-containing protein [Marinicella litoralis]TDR17423.1 VCBS repeat protein [Marinicella litoralis]